MMGPWESHDKLRLTPSQNLDKGDQLFRDYFNFNIQLLIIIQKYFNFIQWISPDLEILDFWSTAVTALLVSSWRSHWLQK